MNAQFMARFLLKDVFPMLNREGLPFDYLPQEIIAGLAQDIIEGRADKRNVMEMLKFAVWVKGRK